MKPSPPRSSTAIVTSWDTPIYLGTIGLAAWLLYLPYQNPLSQLNRLTMLGVMTLGAVTIFLILRAPRYQVWRRGSDWAQHHNIHLPLFLLGIGLGVLAVVRFAVRLHLGGASPFLSVAIWFAGWAALLVAVCRTHLCIGWRRQRLPRAEVLLVLALTLIAAANRFYLLGFVPNIIDGDEGLHGLWAQDVGVASGILTTPFAAMDGLGILYLLVVQQLFQHLGVSPFSLRLLPAIAGTLAIPANYLLARHLLGRRAALIGVGLLAVAHAHIHFSRTAAVLYIYTTLFVPLALYLLITGLERRSLFRLILVALTVCLHINVYVDAWVWLVLLFLLLGAWALIDYSLLQGNRAKLILFLTVLGVFVSPMVIWGLLFPAEFGSRLSADGTFASGWLTREALATGQSPILIVANLFVQALSTFGLSPFIDFYHLYQPTLGPISRVLWLLGLLLALFQSWNRRLVVLNGWFWGGVVALGVVTIPPSTYHYRLLVVLPAACMMIGLAADWLLQQVEHLTVTVTLQRWILPITSGTLLLAMAAINLGTYWSFASSCQFYDRHTRGASLLGTFLRTVPRSTPTFVLPVKDGLRYGPHASVDFLSGRMVIHNIDAPLATAPPAEFPAGPSQGIIVAAPPERQADLEKVRQWYPGGEQVVLSDCGTPILVVYLRQPSPPHRQEP